MYILHQQVKAKSDLKKIWRYSYKKHGEKQADKYYDQLIIGMDNIKENPEIGFSCDYIRTGGPVEEPSKMTSSIVLRIDYKPTICSTPLPRFLEASYPKNT